MHEGTFLHKGHFFMTVKNIYNKGKKQIFHKNLINKQTKRRKKVTDQETKIIKNQKTRKNSYPPRVRGKSDGEKIKNK